MPSVPVVPAPAEGPVLKPPKLSGFQKSILNAFIQPAQEWVVANEPALRAKAQASLTKVLEKAAPTVQTVVDITAKWDPRAGCPAGRKAVDDAFTWAKTQVANFNL